MFHKKANERPFFVMQKKINSLKNIDFSPKTCYYIIEKIYLFSTDKAYLQHNSRYVFYPAMFVLNFSLLFL